LQRHYDTWAEVKRTHLHRYDALVATNTRGGGNPTLVAPPLRPFLNM
jgi:hypothetical protein